MGALDQDCFSEHRSYLLSIGYRMLGSMADAEDLVQETFLRWEQSTKEEVRSPRAFLTTILTRLAINHLDSARVRKEDYVGTWLPEPVLTTDQRDPVQLAESLTMAFLVLLERLTGLERAVFLLHEVFAYSHAEVAGITGSTDDACRQAFRRAKTAIEGRRPRYEPSRREAEQLTAKFSEAVHSGRIDQLIELLHQDVVAYSDSGGRAPAALNPIYGRDRVARFLIGVARKSGSALSRLSAEINYQPGFIGFVNGELHTAIALDVEQERIRNIYIVVNPQKLRNVKEKYYEGSNSTTPSQLPGRFA